MLAVERKGEILWEPAVERVNDLLAELTCLRSLTDYFAMPIYEFHCGKCERDSEILVRSLNWRGAKCPHCGSAKLDKKFSTFASAANGENSSGKNSGGGHGCGGGCSCH
jgi:putative FmdB family regulatory protein